MIRDCDIVGVQNTLVNAEFVDAEIGPRVRIVQRPADIIGNTGYCAERGGHCGVNSREDAVSVESDITCGRIVDRSPVQVRPALKARAAKDALFSHIARIGRGNGGIGTI